ncbi:PP2C family protein-serine/threonine phosphatase [Paenibacillus gorillae]|uniref:PP2C family protein-serine/threonine phosphatase n=1 Tax=Paenibacillus gorillae TaxID=1243662 RepID=UPI0004AF161B|nr:serine/threonine protein phosphatase [Paenibacillus gorillae]
MRKDNSNFKTEFLSEAGNFMENRDYFAYVELDDMACWVAVDGCDTDSEVNSAEMAVQCVLENFSEQPTMSRRKLREYVLEAHEWLRYESRRVRLKASIIVVVTDYTRTVWAVAGNARLYHFRGGRLLARSKDTSLAQTMADRGNLSESAVDRHEERHNLLQYLGNPEGCEPFLSKKIPLHDGDVLLLATQGLWEGVDVPEMLDALEEAQEPSQLVDVLEDVLLSKQRASIGNYTVAAVYADKVYKEDKKKRNKWIKRIAIAMIPVLIAGGMAIYFKGRAAARVAESVVNMQEYGSNGDTYVEEQNYTQAMKSYSEARNEAKKIKDKLHVALYGKNYKKAELIVAGDDFLRDGKYDKALTQYKKAKEETKGDDKYDPEQLDQRIASIDEYIRIGETVQKADLQAESRDYQAALLLYREAHKAALNVSYSGVKDIKTKLDDMEAKIAELEKEQKKLQAESLEKQGNRNLAAGKYAAAIDAFSQSQAVYQEIGMLESVLKLERSITKAEDKLNPIPPASAAGAGGSGQGISNDDLPASVNDSGNTEKNESASNG